MDNKIMDTLIYGNNMNRKIINQESEYNYTINFGISEKIYLETILKTRILTSPRVNEEYTNITFKANKISTFNSFLEIPKTTTTKNKKICYQDALHLIWCICQHIFYLEKENHTFFCLDVNNILVIDDYKFIYLGTEHLTKIKTINDERNNKTIEIITPFFSRTHINESIFISPELRNINYLPAKVNYKACYYSLAGIVFQYLFNIPREKWDILIEEDGLYYDENIYQVNTNIKNTLDNIFSTKLYWFLIKNLSYNIQERTLFFI